MSKEEDDKLDKKLESFLNSQPVYEDLHLTSFPTEMSCTQAFEELYQCYSLSGQFRSVYRYGEMNACRDKRSKMMFCLRMKMADEEERKQQVAQFYKEQLAKKLANNGSSEEIWTRRKTPLNKPFLEE